MALVFLCASAATAQTTFSRIYDLPVDAVFTSAARMPDGGLVLAGQTGQAEEGLLMRVDALGNTLWIKRCPAIGPSDGGSPPPVPYDYNTYSGVTTDPAGNIYVAGSAGNTAGVFGSQFMAAAFNVDGDTLWASVGGSMHSEYYNAIAREADGHLLAAGSFGTLNTRRGDLARIDPLDGSVLSEVSWLWDDSYSAQISRVVPLANGGAIVVGRQEMLFALARFDADLQLTWDTLLAIPGTQMMSIGGLAEGADGSLIAAVTTWTAVEGYTFTLMKWDPDGQLAWANKVSDPVFDLYAVDIGALDDGRILVAGGGGVSATAWAMRFLADGQLELAQRFDNGSPTISVTAMLAEPDGSAFSLVGATLGSDPVLIRADENMAAGDCVFAPMLPSVIPASLTSNGDPNPPSASGFVGARFTVLPYPSYAGGELLCAGGLPPYMASGTIFSDLDGDGLFDPDEPGLPQATVQVQPTGGWIYTVTDSTYLFIAPDSGTYEITDLAPGPWWQLSSDSASYHVGFTAANPVLTDLDFGWEPSVDTTVLLGSYSSGALRCNRNIQQWVHVLNQGTTTPNGIIALTLDELLGFVSAEPAPDSVVGSTVYWHFDALGYYQWSATNLVVSTPSSDFAGDTLESTLRVWADDGDGFELVEEQTSTSVLTCSFDPNDKVVTPVGQGMSGGIAPETPWLDYLIRFQNTGNDTAFSVTVQDQLSANLQWNTVQVIGASHALSSATVNSSGLARFQFDEIDLPDSTTNELASHGFIRFRIKPESDLPHLTMIENNAGVIFDQNTPVVTNTVLNTIVNCAQAQLPLSIQDDGLGGLYAYTFFMDYTQYQYQWYLSGEPIAEANDMLYQAAISGPYSVVLVDPYGCSFTSEELEVIVMSIPEASTVRMMVRPNPFSENALLTSSTPLAKGAPIEVCNMFGQVVRTVRGNGTRQLLIERDGLPAGAYLIRAVTVDGGRVVGRVVIE